MPPGNKCGACKAGERCLQVDKDKEQCCPTANACESDGDFYAYCCEGAQVCAIDPEDSSFLSCVTPAESCGGRACYADTGKKCVDGKSCCAPGTVPCDPSGAVWLCCGSQADCPADPKAAGAACKAPAGRRRRLAAAAGARPLPAWAVPAGPSSGGARRRRRG